MSQNYISQYPSKITPLVYSFCYSSDSFPVDLLKQVVQIMLIKLFLWTGFWIVSSKILKYVFKSFAKSVLPSRLTPFTKSWFHRKALVWFKLDKFIILTVCSSHVTYAFQSESTLYSRLNVKEILARSRHEIWRSSDCNWDRTQNHLVLKRTFNHLAKFGHTIWPNHFSLQEKQKASENFFQLLKVLCLSNHLLHHHCCENWS